ncbi:MAG TPA: helix-turn-helix domain-containing protein [Longimicrobiales bacterium]|nr:helix-turn-helix domain-containing protein [Longimicrobiales bacterium]
MASSEDRLLSPVEVASILKVSERTVRRWAEEGRIPAVKLGSRWRFRRTDLPNEEPTAFQHLDLGDHLHDLPAGLAFPADVFKDLAQRFRDKLEAYDPDIVVIRDRQGHRSAARLRLVPEAYVARVVFSGRLTQMSQSELDALTTGKRILVVDESSARARGHERINELFPRARVQHLVLAVLSETRDAGELKDLGTDFCAEFSPQEFRAFVDDLLLITADTPPLDADHLNVDIGVADGDWVRLKASLYLWGTPFDYTTVLGSEDLEVWTLDDPNFFRLPSGPDLQLQFDGSCKIRLYYRHSAHRLTLVPITYPTAAFAKEDIVRYTEALGWQGAGANLFPPSHEDLSPRAQGIAGYRILTSAVSTQLLVEFLSSIAGVVDTRLIAKTLAVSEHELFDELHAHCAENLRPAVLGSLRDALEGPLTLPGIEPWRAWSVVRYERPLPSAGLTASVFSMRSVGNAAIEWLSKELDRLFSSRVSFQELYVTGRQILKGICDSEPRVTYGDFSRWLDYALDCAVAKPGEVFQVLPDGRYLVQRGYALGEASGRTFDPNRDEGKRFVPSRRRPPMDNQVDRARAALHLALSRLQEGSALAFADEFLINKILANLVADWPGSLQPLHFYVRPYRFGPVVDMPQRFSRLNETLGVRASVLRDPWFEVVHGQGMVRANALDARLRGLRDELIAPEDEQTILTLVDLYCMLVHELDRGDFQKPESLLQLSIVRSEKSALDYVVVEFDVWMDDLRDLAQVLLNMDQSGPKSRDDTRAARMLYKNLRIAALEIERKVGLIRAVPQLIDKLEHLTGRSTTDRPLRGVIRGLREAQAGIRAAEATIDEARRLRLSLEALTELVGQVCAIYFGTRVSDAEVAKYGESLAHLHPYVAGQVDSLTAQVAGRSAEAALRALQRTAEEIYSRGFAVLTQNHLPTMKEHIETVYALARQALSDYSAWDDRPCLMGYLDILGVQTAVMRLIESERAASDVAEALAILCDPITQTLETYYEKHRDEFVILPLRSGGDGWIVAFRNADGPEAAVDSAIEVMKAIRDAGPRMLPVMGLHGGKPQFGIGGPSGMASLIAYLYAERSKLGSSGEILLSEEFAKSLRQRRPLLATRIEQITGDEPVRLPTIGEKHVFRLVYWEDNPLPEETGL